jgi:DNA-binding transcriptional regulator GbsR (MarR family)
VTKKEIGKHFGISDSRVKQVQKWALDQGIVEEVRERIRQTLLPKAADVYQSLFDLPAELLADRKVQKGYELKLKAAKHVADGIGAFRKVGEDTLKATATMDLGEYLAKRRAKLEDAALAPEFEQLSRGTLNSSPSEGDGDWSDTEFIDVGADSNGEGS